MFVDESTINSLRSLSEVDLALHNSQKAAAELPQRAELEAILAKKKAIREKYTQISKLAAALDKQIARFEREIDLLQERMGQAQEKIVESGDDFRAVDSITKDLNAMNEQMEELENGQLDAESKKQSIEVMFDQIDLALKSLLDKEKEVKASLDAEVATIKEFAISRQGMRKEAGAGIPAEVLNLYQKTLKKCGGVAVCELKENACSACRTEFEVAKLHSIKDEAPLTVCPTCGRLMIVEE